MDYLNPSFYFFYSKQRLFSLFTFQSGEVIHNVRQKNFTLLFLTGQIELTPVIMREINISKLESRRKKTLRNLKSVQNNGRVFRLELRTLTIEIQKKSNNNKPTAKPLSLSQYLFYRFIFGEYM